MLKLKSFHPANIEQIFDQLLDTKWTISQVGGSQAWHELVLESREDNVQLCLINGLYGVLGECNCISIEDTDYNNVHMQILHHENDCVLLQGDFYSDKLNGISHEKKQFRPTGTLREKVMRIVQFVLTQKQGLKLPIAS